MRNVCNVAVQYACSWTLNLLLDVINAITRAYVYDAWFEGVRQNGPDVTRIPREVELPVVHVAHQAQLKKHNKVARLHAKLSTAR